MKSALKDVRRVPSEDIEALQKFHQGNLPRPRTLVEPVLLVVDMVGAFVEDDYPTGFSRTGRPCAHEITRLLRTARKRSVPVIYTVSEHLEHSALIGEWSRGSRAAEVPPFCHTDDAHIVVPELTPEEDDIVLSKAKPSAFFGTQLTSVLHALRARSLIVTGMTTSGCIRATVVDSFSHNFHTVVPASCVADRSSLSHETGLFDMGVKYADVVTTESLLVELETGPSPGEATHAR